LPVFVGPSTAKSLDGAAPVERLLMGRKLADSPSANKRERSRWG